jgi:large subunit ribosomal protein L24
MASKIKKGDMVEIIAGEQKGAKGKVMKVLPKANRVLIEGHNLVYKHVRPSQKNPQGGRIRVEQPIHLSNVLPVDPKTTKGHRVKFEEDKKGQKKRMTSEGNELDVVRKATK